MRGTDSHDRRRKELQQQLEPKEKRKKQEIQRLKQEKKVPLTHNQRPAIFGTLDPPQEGRAKNEEQRSPKQHKKQDKKHERAEDCEATIRSLTHSLT